MVFPKRLVAALIAIGSLSACRSDETAARESFASRFTCPNDRITVTPRKDLRAADLAYRAKPPPDDVGKDPERLALWKKEEAKREAEFADKSVYEARGCEHDLFYVCGQLRVSVGATRHGCMSAEYPPGDGGGRP